ncbi:MAG: hypothetical protein ACHQCE_13860 [Streptosporangiales bacterium]
MASATRRCCVATCGQTRTNRTPPRPRRGHSGWRRRPACPPRRFLDGLRDDWGSERLLVEDVLARAVAELGGG